MLWFFDRMETLQRHVARGGLGQRSLRQQIESGACVQCWLWWAEEGKPEDRCPCAN